MELPLFSPGCSAGSRLEAATGTHCPHSGTWAAYLGEGSVVVWVPEGQLMPPATGTPARWFYRADAKIPGYNEVGLLPVESASTQKENY